MRMRDLLAYSSSGTSNKFMTIKKTGTDWLGAQVGEEEGAQSARSEGKQSLGTVTRLVGKGMAFYAALTNETKRMVKVGVIEFMP